MAVMKSAVSRMSEKGVLAKIDATATSASDSLLARFLTRIEPVLSLSTAAWLRPRFSSRVAKVELSDGPEQIPYGCSSVSPCVVQAMMGLGQASGTGSEAGQEASAL